MCACTGIIPGWGHSFAVFCFCVLLASWLGELFFTVLVINCFFSFSFTVCMVEERFSLSWLQLCAGLVLERILLFGLHSFSDFLDFIGLSLCWLWLLVLQVYFLGKRCYYFLLHPFVGFLVEKMFYCWVFHCVLT